MGGPVGPSEAVEPQAITEPPALASRRSLLGWLLGAIGALIAGVVGIPAIGSIFSAAVGRRQPSVITLGKLADYTVGQPKLAQFTVNRTDGWVTTIENRGVWVVKRNDQEAVVYNGRCTHLGCAYSWKTSGPGANHFACPCHDGTFNLDGSVVSGPPPRPLDALPARLDAQGTLVITYQDFRLGVPGKEPV
jgi:menaquinol-cytochrome c reductase iron-sulfur subunit